MQKYLKVLSHVRKCFSDNTLHIPSSRANDCFISANKWLLSLDKEREQRRLAQVINLEGKQVLFSKIVIYQEK